MSYTNVTRLTGLASGIDTDSYVKQLMHAESTKYYNYQRKVQKVQWQQEIYRTHIKSIQNFQSKWLDVTSSTSVRLQKNINNKYKASAVLGNGSEAKNISVSDVKGAGSHTIEVLEKATTAKLQGSAAVSGTVTGAEFKVNVTYDGDTKEITATTDTLQTALNDAFGSGKVKASITDGKVEINAVNAEGNVENGHELKLEAVENGNFTIDKATNKVSTSDKLSDLLGADFLGGFTINGKPVVAKADMTVKELMDEINNIGAGVKMSYNSIAGMFSLETTEAGSTSKIELEDSNGLFKALGFTETNAVGTNAKLVVDGVETISASNKLEFDEFTVDIKNAAVNETITVNSDKDVDAVYDMIKSFVDDYNSLIEGIKKETTTTRPEGANGYYEPLTDAEKEEMDEDDIKKWEEQAKKGLLYRDDYLEKFLSNARTSIYEVSTKDSEGNKVGIYNYGITTSSDTSQGGKLVIDEAKLKKAISEEPEAVTALVTGIADKLEDVVDKYTDTGGLLTVKAGIEGKGSEFDNYMRTEINGIKDKMALELERLKDKEQRYYAMFAAMEDKVSSNNSLLDTLYSFTG